MKSYINFDILFFILLIFLNVVSAELGRNGLYITFFFIKPNF
jgi:hypothetical protein